MNRIVIALAAAIIAGPVAAEEAATPDMSGTWSGKGFVQKDENARKINIRCKVEGEQSGAKVGFDGVCRAMLVMKREIGAWLTRDGNNFTGTYKGAEVGLSKLNGEEKSDGKIVLEMTFPREVHTDDKGVMTITLEGPNDFSIKTQDEMDNGETITTSQINFVREEKVAEK